MLFYRCLPRGGRWWWSWLIWRGCRCWTAGDLSRGSPGSTHPRFGGPSPQAGGLWGPASGISAPAGCLHRPVFPSVVEPCDCSPPQRKCDFVLQRRQENDPKKKKKLPHDSVPSLCKTVFMLFGLYLQRQDLSSRQWVQDVAPPGSPGSEEQALGSSEGLERGEPSCTGWWWEWFPVDSPSSDQGTETERRLFGRKIRSLPLTVKIFLAWINMKCWLAINALVHLF